MSTASGCIEIHLQNFSKQFCAGTGTTGETNPVKPVSEES
jgi:hypothetical protein